MTNKNILPEGFQDLEPLVEHWARPTENERNVMRLMASAEDFASFYAAMMPRLDALLELLGNCPPKPESEAEYNALMLACAYAEATPHHELYGGSAEVPHSFDARRFVPDHGTNAL